MLWRQAKNSPVKVKNKTPVKLKNKKRKGRRSQGKVEQKAELDSASEKTSQYDGTQLNLKGNCTADGIRGSTAILNVCAYNVRTLRTEDDLDRFIDELERIKLDIIVLCETYRRREGLSEIRAGYWMYESGKTNYNPNTIGLAFLMHPKLKDCVTDLKTCSNRVLKWK